MKEVTILPAESQEVARQTAVVPHEAQVDRIASLRDLAATIHRQAEDVIAIYLHHRQRGGQDLTGEWPDHESMDHKLRQLQHFVTELRDIIDPEREVEKKAKWLEEQRKKKLEQNVREF